MQETRRILIVDGDHDVAEVVAYKLNNWGFGATTAGRGELGFELAKELLPDIIVIDLLLPTISGLELCQMIRNEPSLAHTPIIMLAKRGESDHIKRARKLGADSILVKPLDPADLLSRINSLTRQKAS